MLEQLGEQVRGCLEQAADAQAKADATDDLVLKAEFLAMERLWLTLARSYGFTESLEDFTKANLVWQRKFDATVEAIVNLSHSDTPDGLNRAIEGRIQALANVHALLFKSRWVGAELSSIVAQELAPYLGEDKARARINGPDVLLAPNTAQAIAITLHELATNAAKYGSLSVPTGRLEVTWLRVADGPLILRWTESGGPPTRNPKREGFGTSVIERMIREQLKGETHFDWRPEGLACEIRLPSVMAVGPHKLEPQAPIHKATAADLILSQ